jgi:hypothetical protein
VVNLSVAIRADRLTQAAPAGVRPPAAGWRILVDAHPDSTTHDVLRNHGQLRSS